jgi:hypothetical protein
MTVKKHSQFARFLKLYWQQVQHRGSWVRHNWFSRTSRLKKMGNIPCACRWWVRLAYLAVGL